MNKPNNAEQNVMNLILISKGSLPTRFLPVSKRRVNERRKLSYMHKAMSINTDMDWDTDMIMDNVQVRVRLYTMFMSIFISSYYSYLNICTNLENLVKCSVRKIQTWFFKNFCNVQSQRAMFYKDSTTKSRKIVYFTVKNKFKISIFTSS
jgi:hypothetical protein